MNKNKCFIDYLQHLMIVNQWYEFASLVEVSLGQLQSHSCLIRSCLKCDIICIQMLRGHTNLQQHRVDLLFKKGILSLLEMIETA